MPSPSDTPVDRQPVPGRRIRDYYRAHAVGVGVGVVALLVTNLLALLVPALMGRAVDQVSSRSAEAVGWTALYIAGIALGAALARIVSRVFLFNAGRGTEHDIRQELFAHLTTMSPGFFGRHSIGDLVSRVTNDLGNVRVLLGFGVLTIINTTLVFAGNLPLIFLIDARLALVALAPLPLLVLVTRYGARAIYLRSQVVQATIGDLSSRVTESLAGNNVVRSFGREEAEIEAFERLNQDYYRHSLDLAWVRNLLWPVSGLVFGIGSLLVIWYGGLRAIAGVISIGEFVEFNTRLAILAWPTLAIGWVAGMWQRGRASMERINAIFSELPAISDGEGVVAHQLEGAISARDLTVKYEGAAESALRGVSFDLPAGGLLGVVGRTGSGKSSLARALLRLVEIGRGQLFVDGRDITDVRLVDLRRAIGYAEQDAFLFSATLRENLCFARPDADDAAVQTAVQDVHLEADLEALPDGLETPVGERGVTLSGGQRQRAVLARALLSQPTILLLDDSLAAVDAETEAAILKRLSVVARRQTSIIVSHRLSAVRAADEILVLDRGEVVERGRHDDLIQQSGLYSELWGRQTAERELERHEVTS